MSSEGYLYITEVWYEEVKDGLDKRFGEGKWCLEVSKEQDMIVSKTQMPNELIIKVSGEEEEIIAKIIAKNKFYVEETTFGEKYVECEPDTYEIEVL